MALKDVTDREAVLSAIKEFDAIGREAFLAKYNFAPAKRYFIEQNGKVYDSKAIAGAAHGYQHGPAMNSGDFSGGEATVAPRLEKLGFKVTRPDTLPDWQNDELILALDLYVRTRGKMGYSPTVKVVTDLSDELRSLRIFSAAVTSNPLFRNASGVALKLHNFSSIDPSQPGKGMSHGGLGDQRTWDLWAHRPDELAVVAAAIKAKGHFSDLGESTGEDEEYSAPEGRILFRAHRRYERDKKLVARKKAQVLKQTGRLACEVCDFESSEVYGKAVFGVVDIHHLVPLHKIGVSKTTLADLAVLCPTCHRVIHKHSPFITPKELQAKLPA
jgi:5-methylcytosine-specific restriction protein A